MPHPAALSDDELLRECVAERHRRGGPGGQHRNKVETAVTLTHQPTGLSAQASERRSQRENHAAALRRLRIELAIEVREAHDAPSALWRSRVRDGKIALSEKHADYPAMLAEAMDALAACDMDPAAAATRLGATATQIVKLIRTERRAIEKINAARNERGLRPLH